MHENSEMDFQTNIFRMLADKTRLRTLLLLYYRELCVCEICDILNVSQPKVSRHLAKLRDSDFVKIVRDGQWVFYKLNNSDTNRIMLLKAVLEQVSTYNSKLGLDEDILRMQYKVEKNELCSRKFFKNNNEE